MLRNLSKTALHIILGAIGVVLWGVIYSILPGSLNLSLDEAVIILAGIELLIFIGVRKFKTIKRQT